MPFIFDPMVVFEAYRVWYEVTVSGTDQESSADIQELQRWVLDAMPCTRPQHRSRLFDSCQHVILHVRARIRTRLHCPRFMPSPPFFIHLQARKGDTSRGLRTT